MNSFTKQLFLIFLCGWIMGSAYAARPFMTDDARLTTEGSCQLESWTRRYQGRFENWALPACNPTGKFEITAGGGYFSMPSLSDNHTTDYMLQVKSLFRPLTANDYGWGLAVGTINHPAFVNDPNNAGSTYAYVPLTISRMDDKLGVHSNLGITNDYSSKNSLATYGLGAEYWITPVVMVMAETFGDHRQRPFFQAGMRYSIIPGLFQVDVTYGVQPGHSEANSWISFGLRYTPDKLYKSRS
jgi:hypothetical protein